MGLEALIALVKPECVAALPALAGADNWQVTTRVSIDGDLPRVVWRPTSEAFAPAQKIARPRSLQTVRTELVVELWAESITAVEDLRDLVTRAIKHQAYAAVRFERGAWGSAGDSTRGESYTLTLSVEFSQRDSPVTQATPTSAAIVADPSASSGDGALSSGDP